MQDHHTPDPAFKFKPDYKWPEPGNERNFPIMVNPGGVINASFNSLKKI